MKEYSVISKNRRKVMDIELDNYGCVLCDENWNPEEYVPYHRIYYVYGGEAYCKINGQTHQLKEGRLYFLPVNTMYELSHNKDNPLECMYLHIYTMPLISTSIREIDVEEGGLLSIVLESLRQLMSCGHEYASLMAQVAVLVDVLSEYITYEFMENIAVMKALDTIEKEYNTKLTNETLAKEFGYNTNYFIRMFATHMGIPPKAYIEKYRLRMAIQFLIEGKTVQEVANKVSYSDSNSFCRFFKRKTGIAPSKFLKYYDGKVQP